MGFGPVQQLTEEEKFVHMPMSLISRILGGTHIWHHSGSGVSHQSLFLNSLNWSTIYAINQLGHSITGRFVRCYELLLNHADLFCLFGMVKRVRLHMGWGFVEFDEESVLHAWGYGYATSHWRQLWGEWGKITQKRPRTVWREVSYSDAFQQQVLAQLAAMNMRFDRIDDRLEEIAAENLL
nr:hypothetical protein Iba_chr05eCG10910 [Ipomoea batatas]